MNKKTKHHIFSLTGGILIFILLSVITIRTAKTARRSTGNAIERISDFYIEELAKGRVSIVSNELEQKQNYLNNAVNAISANDLSSIKSLRTYLKKIRHLYGMETFALVDENNLVYTGRSTFNGKTRYPFLSEKINKPVYSTVLNYGGEKQLFLIVPVSGLYFNHSKITACFAEINIDQMMSFLVKSQNNSNVFFNLYYRKGESLVNSEFGKFKAGQNILSVIKNNTEDPVVYAKTQWDFYEGNSGFVDIPYENQIAHV